MRDVHAIAYHENFRAFERAKIGPDVDGAVRPLFEQDACGDRVRATRGDQILAIPTLVRKLPEPVRKIIGDLSNTERVLIGLDLLPRE